MDRELGRTQKTVLLVLATLWAIVIVATAAHKSGDLPPQLAQSERLLHGLPLYETNPSLGAWWPPFTAALLAPFALLARASLPLAKAAWALLGIACVAWSVVRAGRLWGWWPAGLALLVVARPLHNSFEHGQISALLLAPIVAAAAELRAGRELRAGAWIGTAAAAKAFPALLLPYLAWTGRWRACVAGVALGAALTIGAMLSYGPVDAVRAVLDWLALAGDAPGAAGFRMQKLGRLVGELGGPPAATIALAVLLLAVTAATLKRPGPPDDTLREVGIVTLLAVLLSPIGWYYYFGLLYPAWVAALRDRPRPEERRVWYGALVLAAVLTAALPRLLLTAAPVRFLAANNDTLGALLLFALLVGARWRPAHPNPQVP